ncbi:MAG: hypothetical protein JO173_09015 [Gammaproteobacteria bacterium]|nr:hypothetical protein [Gammaproteobacteria bacterium]
MSHAINESLRPNQSESTDLGMWQLDLQPRRSRQKRSPLGDDIIYQYDPRNSPGRGQYPK